MENSTAFDFPNIKDPLKIALLRAAAAGWNKPRQGTKHRLQFDQYILGDAVFAEQMGRVRPDWLTGDGVSLAGTLHQNLASPAPATKQSGTSLSGLILRLTKRDKPDGSSALTLSSLENEDDYRAALMVAADAFSHVCDELYAMKVIRKSSPDRALSVAVKDGNRVVGCYFLAQANLPYDWAKGLRGLEGVALGLDPEYRYKGIGRKLMALPAEIEGFDYVWGYQLETLENLNEWKSRRTHLDTKNGCHITAEGFTPEVRALFDANKWCPAAQLEPDCSL